VGNANGWFVMGGYRCGDVLPHVTFSRQRVKDNWVRRFSGEVNSAALSAIGETLDNLAQAFIVPNRFFDGGVGDQTALTIGARWDLFEGIAIKGEWQHVHPDNRSRGLFDLHPNRSVNIYSVSLDAII